jgi:ABC-type spermidine/putrescine transport system permease subunit II
MLVLHAFPAMTLIIPIFLMLHWIGLLDTIVGVMLVLAAIELPFYVFVMKGFFDGVPWDIEMSAMTDGATRRQAFYMVVLPQVRFGLIAVAVFAFIRAWEEYIFVRTFLIENKNWVMSLYLFWVSDDVMGVDYGIVAAVAVFYAAAELPALRLLPEVPDADDHRRHQRVNQAWRESSSRTCARHGAAPRRSPAWTSRSRMAPSSRCWGPRAAASRPR